MRAILNDIVLIETDLTERELQEEVNDILGRSLRDNETLYEKDTILCLQGSDKINIIEWTEDLQRYTMDLEYYGPDSYHLNEKAYLNT